MALSRGVLHVVSTKGKPVPVNDAIIASLRERVGPGGFVELCDERRIEILIQTLQESLEISGDSHQEPNAVRLQTAALS